MAAGSLALPRLAWGKEARLAALGMGVTLAYFLAVFAAPSVDRAGLLSIFRTLFSGMLISWLLLTLVATFVLLWKERPKNGPGASPFAVLRVAAARRIEGEGLVSLFWPLLLFAMLISAFTAFKQNILSIRPYTNDAWLAEADRWLFLGKDGWRFFHDLFGTPAMTGAMDTLYHMWFLPMGLGVILCAMLGADHYRLRAQYLLTYIFVWIGLGSVLAFLFPSAGPCFHEALVGPHASYEALSATLAAHDAALGHGGGNLIALGNMEMLLRHHGGDTLVLGGGISAMPSVHNGLAVLFALGAFRLNRWLGYAMATYAVLIWVGSVYLGWHYGWDGIVSAVLVIAFWKLAGRLADAIAESTRPAARLARA